MNRGLDIQDAVVGVILTEIAQCLLELFGYIGIGLNPWSKPPEQIWCHCQITCPGPALALLANTLVHPEDFRNDNDRGLRRASGAGDIGRNPR